MADTDGTDLLQYQLSRAAYQAERARAYQRLNDAMGQAFHRLQRNGFAGRQVRRYWLGRGKTTAQVAVWPLDTPIDATVWFAPSLYLLFTNPIDSEAARERHLRNIDFQVERPDRHFAIAQGWLLEVRLDNLAIRDIDSLTAAVNGLAS